MTQHPDTELTIAVFGLRWRIDLRALFPTHADLAARLHHLWARAVVEPDGSERTFTVVASGADIPDYHDGVPLGAVLGDPVAFPYVLSRAITMASLAHRAGAALLLHAAGLVPADGKAIVLVAGSGTGKSTLVRTIGPGWGYVTDESVVVEPDLTISTYPKPISLAAPDRPGDKDETSPDDLGLGVPPARVEVGAVVTIARTARPGPPTLDRISLIDGILAVIPHSGSINLLNHPLQWLARTLTRGGGPYHLDYAEIEQCKELLSSLPLGSVADDEVPPMTAWLAHSPSTPGQRAAVDAPASTGERADTPLPALEPSTSLVRAPWTDAIEADGEVLVLTGDRPARLAGIGATIWLACDRPRTVAELTATAVAAHGAHPQAETLMADALRAVTTAALLTFA